MIVLQLFAVFFLVGTNAFFAAAEFSLVAVRSSRVRQLVDAGDPRAKIVEFLLGDVGRVVSAVQVGITIASLLLDYLAARRCNPASMGGGDRARRGAHSGRRVAHYASGRAGRARPQEPQPRAR